MKRLTILIIFLISFSGCIEMSQEDKVLIEFVKKNNNFKVNNLLGFKFSHISGTYDGKVVELRILKVKEIPFLEIRYSTNNLRPSYAIINKRFYKYFPQSEYNFKDSAFDFWPYIDSPIAESNNTVWAKDIEEITRGPELSGILKVFSVNREGGRRIMEKIKSPQKFSEIDLFYYSQGDYFTYIKIDSNFTERKVSEGLENFRKVLNDLE